MEKLNTFGLEVLSYKEELMKDYSEIVKKSLKQSIEILFKNNLIDSEILNTLDDPKYNKESLREILYKKKNCTKTREELNIEFEKIKENLDKKLDIMDIKIVSDIDNENMIIARNFNYDKSFAKDFFGVKETKSLNILMSRQGVFEKFSILRLNKIIKSFINDYEEDNLEFDITYSDVFFESVEEAYGISLILKINVSKLEKEENLDIICKKISKIIEEASNYFDKRMFI